MAFISRSFGISWLNHDSWSETYVGTRRVVYEILPPSSTNQAAEDGALCQMAIVGANHLMEVALFGLLKPYVNAANESFSITQEQFERVGYYEALTDWVLSATGRTIDLTLEPFLSTELLRKRRNATVHKPSAIATSEMARSALFSAVQGSKELYNHFGITFRYIPFIQQYTLPDAPPFSQSDAHETWE